MVTRTAFLCGHAAFLLRRSRNDEPAREHLDRFARRLDPLPQHLILRLQLDQPLASLLELGPGRLAALGLGLRELAPPLGGIAGASRRAPRSGAVAAVSSSASAFRSGRVVAVRHRHSPPRVAPAPRRRTPSSSSSAVEQPRLGLIHLRVAQGASGARNVSRNATLRRRRAARGPGTRSRARPAPAARPPVRRRITCTRPPRTPSGTTSASSRSDAGVVGSGSTRTGHRAPGRRRSRNRTGHRPTVACPPRGDSRIPPIRPSAVHGPPSVALQLAPCPPGIARAPATSEAP